MTPSFSSYLVNPPFGDPEAGLMARKAGVRELVVFHFSPRYTGQGDAIYQEAREEFSGAQQKG